MFDLFCVVTPGCGGFSEHIVPVSIIIKPWLCWYLGCFNNLYEFADSGWILEVSSVIEKYVLVLI